MHRQYPPSFKTEMNFKKWKWKLYFLVAEGAFDSIPHPVLFKKAMGVLSEKSWKLLYEWYSAMTVRVKWNVIGCDILVEKGMRQGGLTSPMLFNLLYKDLIDGLANYDGGIAIGSIKYNVICYADDILVL